MNFYGTKPIQPVGDSYHEESEFPLPIMEKGTKSKVKNLVLGLFVQSENWGALLPSALAPSVVMDRVSGILASPFWEEGAPQKENESLQPKKDSRRSKLRRGAGREIPVGLRRLEPGWINPMNALMQFLIYLPGFVDLFYYAPRSFHYFLDFIEQYLLDQEDKKAISSANSAVLVRCLMKTLPSHLFRRPQSANFYEILQAFPKVLFPHLRSFSTVKSKDDSLILHPERQAIWDASASENLEEVIQKKVAGMPNELLIGVKGGGGTSCRLVKKQFFTPNGMYYDLNAFIERRPDVGEEAHYIAYVKIDGVWYQCDDDRITQIRSHCLQFPLHSSTLLYFKRIEFSNPTFV